MSYVKRSFCLVRPFSFMFFFRLLFSGGLFFVFSIFYLLFAFVVFFILEKTVVENERSILFSLIF